MNRFEALYPKDSWENQIKQILTFVKSGDSCQIIGFPGVGRSNLLGLLSYNRAVRIHHFGDKQNKFHFTLMNFSEARNMESQEILKFFFVSIIDSLKERKMEKESEFVKSVLTDSIKTQDRQLLLHGLKKIIDFLCLEKGLTIIFLFDRFEEYTTKVDAEFFAILRSLRNRAKYKFSCVFSVGRPIEEVLEREIYRDFYEFLEGNQIFLPLRDVASLTFRISYIEDRKNKKLPKDVLDQILNLTGGHGKLTRFCVDTYLSSNNQTIKQSSNLSDFFLSENKVRSTLLDIWKYLTPEEQRLLAISNLPAGKAGQQLAISFLEQIELIRDGKIAIPLFEEFIKSNQQGLRKATEGKIVYDQSSNEIKKGDSVLSDSLTSSEFKLLKFLIANEGKVVDRDEIINAVWKDLSSTAGVTEQALDQLIFRLRKKIEDNPNSPTHTLTVKGRGFKFTA